MTRAGVDIEGDWMSWWYVCGECHGSVDPKAKTCPGCGAELDWAGVQLKPKTEGGKARGNDNG